MLLLICGTWLLGGGIAWAMLRLHEGLVTRQLQSFQYVLSLPRQSTLSCWLSEARHAMTAQGWAGLFTHSRPELPGPSAGIRRHSYRCRIKHSRHTVPDNLDIPPPSAAVTCAITCAITQHGSLPHPAQARASRHLGAVHKGQQHFRARTLHHWLWQFIS
jgi:hypothetical protein